MNRSITLTLSLACAVAALTACSKHDSTAADTAASAPLDSTSTAATGASSAPMDSVSSASGVAGSDGASAPMLPASTASQP